MKIIFAGTPEFAIPSLLALLNSQHKICAVYTQPDRPAGRGQKITASPIKQLAITNNLPVYQPINLKELEIQQQLQHLAADIFVDVAYGVILPEAVLSMFKFGCINIHPSLLPKWRGAAPIQRAIMFGDKATGVSIMKIAKGLDTGAIYKQEILPIENTDTSATLAKKAADLGAKLLLKVLDAIQNGTAKTFEQDDTKSTYAQKITKEEGKINWQKSAYEIACMIRAFNPWPIAYAEIDDKTVRIWEAQVLQNNIPEIKKSKPGTIIAANKNGIDVVTGAGVLRLLKLQLPNRKVLPIADFLNGQEVSETASLR
jgi:methionyl-tRNA formyltransferase